MIDVRITRERSDGGVLIELASEGVPHILMVGIVDEAEKRIVWNIVADVSEVHVSTSNAEPSDPLARLAYTASRYGRPLAACEYGVVPPGFKQTQPPSGSAPALTSDRRYRVIVLGSSVSEAAFHF